MLEKVIIPLLFDLTRPVWIPLPKVLLKGYTPVTAGIQRSVASRTLKSDVEAVCKLRLACDARLPADNVGAIVESAICPVIVMVTVRV